MKLKLNDNLIVRDEDGTLFNFEEFRVHQFNDLGIDLISILKEEKTKNEWLLLAKDMKVSEEDFNFFYNKCIESDIIVKL